MTNSNNYCVIMAGGIGSRFWPYSRKSKPKQFLDFFGTGNTLLQQTFDRYSQIVTPENIIVITNAEYEELVKEQLPLLKEEQIILEPTRRNTAPCIAMAAMYIRSIHPDANMIVAPADHLILKEKEFNEAIHKGLEFVAQSPQLLTLGIKPTRPDTGYGYIQIEENKGNEFYKVKTFIEKPQLEFAEVFVESDEFYWNSGIFLWNVNTIIDAFQTLMPEIYSKITSGLMTSLAPIFPSTMLSWKRQRMYMYSFAISVGQTWVPGPPCMKYCRKTSRKTLSLKATPYCMTARKTSSPCRKGNWRLSKDWKTTWWPIPTMSCSSARKTMRALSADT